MLLYNSVMSVRAAAEVGRYPQNSQKPQQSKEKKESPEKSDFQKLFNSYRIDIRA